REAVPLAFEIELQRLVLRDGRQARRRRIHLDEAVRQATHEDAETRGVAEAFLVHLLWIGRPSVPDGDAGDLAREGVFLRWRNREFRDQDRVLEVGVFRLVFELLDRLLGRDQD